MKKMTVQRLELDAACMASQLALSLVDALDYTFSRVVLWTNSMIVLHWMRQPSNKYRNHVAHRIADVNSNLESLSASGQRLVEIRYVPTSLNVADGGTVDCNYLK